MQIRVRLCESLVIVSGWIREMRYFDTYLDIV